MSKQKVNCAKGTREADLGHAVLSASGSHRRMVYLLQGISKMQSKSRGKNEVGKTGI